MECGRFFARTLTPIKATWSATMLTSVLVRGASGESKAAWGTTGLQETPQVIEVDGY